MFMFNILFVFASLCPFNTFGETRPNIIFILADDMGWNDVSFHGSLEISTPNLDALSASGITLQRHYVMSQCTPSRGALMTGIYPIHFGLQHHVINAAAPNGLPLHMKILPGYLKDLGYATHGIGKWHLGYHKKAYTPTHRGFDTFFGYWNSHIDYYDYTSYDLVYGIPDLKVVWGVDLHNGTDTMKHVRGKYATDLFTEVAVDVIKKHNNSQPLFLYVPHLACHVGNSYNTLQAPLDHVAKFTHIKDADRKTFAGMISKLDESVGLIFEALHQRDMLQNSIIVFSSDNGGDPEGRRGERSSNWPLRSVKFQLWEGGVRVPALVWSPLLKLTEPKTYADLIHVSDWLPTLYAAAGGHVKELGKIDGINMWEHLVKGTPSPRKEILLNIDQIDGTAAIIDFPFKLIVGQYPNGRNSWYGNSGSGNVNVVSADEWVWKEGSRVKDILSDLGMWLLKVPDEWRTDLKIDCGTCHSPNLNHCDLTISPCLFDIDKDPCELDNLANKFSEIVDRLLERIKEYNSTSVPPQVLPVDSRGDPRCHGFAFVPWLDEDFKNACPFFS